MQWIRKVSLVKRVVSGFSGMGLITASIGAVAVLEAPTPTHAWGFGLVTGAGCLIGTLACWIIVGSIRASVQETVQSVILIAGGDLETKIESPGKDEISWLRAELNGMRKKLRKTVLTVRETVDSVNTASDEIASGNLDLSNRTETQAGALQETASSIRQLADTVRSNTESTNEAKAVVAQSSDVAARGAQLMQEVVVRMGEINASASKISEIIGVIDGIAFQTNILALNAAVEAARAGDQGRGFAVVASEVRSLAQRSSTAAREIKTLIGDSTEKVDAGSKLVNDAGRTMQDILDSVKQVSKLISTIADAGQSQSSDISHVNQAVAQIDTMTQQNAALVEQLAAAAQSLRGQSGLLTDSMSSFRVTA